MRAFSVIGGGIVPVLINVQPNWKVVGIDVIQLTVTVISLLVVVFVSLESVFHYREQWKNYRSTEQSLGHVRGNPFGSSTGHATPVCMREAADFFISEHPFDFRKIDLGHMSNFCIRKLALSTT